MPTAAATGYIVEYENDELNDLFNSIVAIADTDAAQFVQIERLGVDLNFAPAGPAIAQIINLYKQLAACDISPVSQPNINSINNHIQELNAYFEELLEFSPVDEEYFKKRYGGSGYTAKQIRDELIKRADSLYHSTFMLLYPLIGYLTARSIDLPVLKAEFEDRLAQLKSLQNELVISQQVRLKELDSRLALIEQVAQKTGVSAYATHFKEEAQIHETAANRWLYITGGLAVVTLLTGGVITFLAYRGLFQAKTDTPQLIQLGIAKLFLLSTLLSAAFWASRVFRAHQHNTVVNRHRMNALNSFQTFVISAGDDQQTKNAILLQATQCIFSPQPTGYVTSEADIGAPTQIFEIVRGISGSQAKS